MIFLQSELYLYHRTKQKFFKTQKFLWHFGKIFSTRIKKPESVSKEIPQAIRLFILFYKIHTLVPFWMFIFLNYKSTFILRILLNITFPLEKICILKILDSKIIHYYSNYSIQIFEYTIWTYYVSKTHNPISLIIKLYSTSMST